MLVRSHTFNLDTFLDFCQEFKKEKYFFYIGEFFDDFEYFFKFGITADIDTRFSTLIEYEMNYLIILEDTPKNIWETEFNFRQAVREFKYTPGTDFGGFTECFYIPHDELFKLYQNVQRSNLKYR